jgi:glucokinase
MTSGSWIGIDIGATKILGCVFDTAGDTLATTTRATPLADATSIENALLELTSSLLADHPVGAVGIAVAGWVDHSRRSVLFSAHLPWRYEPVADKLSARLGLPVVLENDANAATWAEYQFGAGRDLQDFVVVTVGSGIGSGIIADGRLLRGAHGLAGEFGHSVVAPDGPECPCGRRGCVDSLASGRALQRRFHELRSAASLVQGARQSAIDDEGVTGDVIAAAAHDGDPLALQAFTDIGSALGRGLADLVMCLDPEAVILAGGVAAAGELLRSPTDASLHQCLVAREHFARTDVLISPLSGVAGALGVAHLASVHDRSTGGQPA